MRCRVRGGRGAASRCRGWARGCVASAAAVTWAARLAPACPAVGQHELALRALSGICGRLDFTVITEEVTDPGAEADLNPAARAEQVALFRYSANRGVRQITACPRQRSGLVASCRPRVIRAFGDPVTFSRETSTG